MPGEGEEVPPGVRKTDALRKHALFFMEKHMQRLKKKLKEDPGPRPVVLQAPPGRVYTKDDKCGICTSCKLPLCDCCKGCAERKKSNKEPPPR